jgi:hypothetical protein
MPSARVTATKKVITREDVNEIIQHRRAASFEDLQYVIDHAKDYN